MKDGYLCGGGGHVVPHAEAEALLQGLRSLDLRVEEVNTMPGERVVTPPPDGWHEPMHWDPARRGSAMMVPMAKKAGGQPYTVQELKRGFAALRRRMDDENERDDLQDLLFGGSYGRGRWDDEAALV